MKTYGRRLIRRSAEKSIAKTKENRYAIVRSVDKLTRSAIVRVQGSDVDIYIDWPEGKYQQPPWLRVGNAVVVQHPEGSQTKMVMIGEGASIPTPVGAGSVLPTQPVTENKVISGCGVVVGSGMNLDVYGGEYRIGNIIYELNPTSVELSAAPSSPDFRIDMLYVGTDGILHLTTGTPHATAPEPPDLVSEHVAIKYIMVPYGTTQIDQVFVGTTAAPAFLQFTLSMSSTSLEWGTTTTTGTLSMLDQYGKPFSITSTAAAEILSGNGLLQHASDTPSTSITWSMSGTSTTFTYTRGGIDNIAVMGSPVDSAPMLKVTLGDGDYRLAPIEIYDSLGDFMH